MRDLARTLRRHLDSILTITGAKVYPVSGPAIDNGALLMRDGLIFAVGANVDVRANATHRRNGTFVTPGIVNYLTHRLTTAVTEGLNAQIQWRKYYSSAFAAVSASHWRATLAD